MLDIAALLPAEGQVLILQYCHVNLRGLCMRFLLLNKHFVFVVRNQQRLFFILPELALPAFLGA